MDAADDVCLRAEPIVRGMVVEEMKVVLGRFLHPLKLIVRYDRGVYGHGLAWDRYDGSIGAMGHESILGNVATENVAIKGVRKGFSIRDTAAFHRYKVA